jgi:UDP-N-acetylmuramoyl-tripeptide--D-alanyl-D-alanine ligase
MTPIPTNAARMTAWGIATATSGAARQDIDDRVLTGMTTDSRAVHSGCAFVALRGTAHDGHDFVPAAIAAGATLVVVEKGRAEGLTGAIVVEVDDTLDAWGALGRAHLRRWRRMRSNDAARTVAITGSAGKTTAKELCATILGALARCTSTPGNLNNRIGVPAVALTVPEEDRFAVFELGMSVRGEMATLAKVVEPDVAVLLNVGVAHAGGVGGTRADVAREKGALLEALGQRGFAIVNADDPAAYAQLTRTRAGRVATFGRSAGAHYRLVERALVGEGASHLVVELRRPSGSRIMEVGLPLVGEAAAISFLAALAAAEAAVEEDLSPALVTEALTTLRSIAGRAAVRRLRSDILVLDDTYNANPASMRAAIQTTDEIARAGRRRAVAVLGEMLELGPLGPLEHDRIGDELVNCHVALAIGCGGLIDHALERAAKGGVQTVPAESTQAAAEIALREVKAGDIVLLKGSRGVAVERVFEALAEKWGIDPAWGPR